MAFNCTISQCSSTAICWWYTIFFLPFLVNLCLQISTISIIVSLFSTAGFSTTVRLQTLHKLQQFVLVLLNGVSFNTSTSSRVTDTSSNLTDHAKLLGVALDSHLSFDNHISNLFSSSYFYIRALRYICPFLYTETTMTIAYASVGSRLDYAIISILNGILSCNILQL